MFDVWLKEARYWFARRCNWALLNIGMVPPEIIETIGGRGGLGARLGLPRYRLDRTSECRRDI